MSSSEERYPFHEPSAAKLASGFTTQFPKIIHEPQFLGERMVPLTEFAQKIFGATDAKSLATDSTMTFDNGGNFSFGISEEVKLPANEVRASVIMGDKGVELSNEPYPISYYDALSYLARPDRNRMIQEIYDLPTPFDDIVGFRTYLIAWLCQNDERLIEWVKTPQGNMNLRTILLDSAITDRADIERYRLRWEAFDLKDELPITRCVTKTNYKQVDAMFAKFTKDLTQKNKPSPFAPLLKF